MMEDKLAHTCTNSYRFFVWRKIFQKLFQTFCCIKVFVPVQWIWMFANSERKIKNQSNSRPFLCRAIGDVFMFWSVLQMVLEQTRHQTIMSSIVHSQNHSTRNLCHVHLTVNKIWVRQFLWTDCVLFEPNNDSKCIAKLRIPLLFRLKFCTNVLLLRLVKCRCCFDLANCNPVN